MSKTRTLERRRLRGRDGEVVEVDAILIGEGSSYAVGKTRWFEVFIYVDANDEYIVHTVGRSLVVGETDRCRVERTSSPYDVIEILTVSVLSSRQASATHGRRAQAPYVPRASARALAQAAEYDDGIQEAYIRLVA